MKKSRLDTAICIENYVEKLDEVIEFLKFYVDIIEADDDNRSRFKKALRKLEFEAIDLKKVKSIEKANKIIKVNKIVKSGDFDGKR